MHGILPSEIARLVLDYLEASSCPDAARLFLETSPDLQECRRVAASGGRFITRVFGLTLINMLHTFCDIYGLVQERLNKIDNDQLRRCENLCEQLRTLIDGCHCQQFFINDDNRVPTQLMNHMTTGCSPIITSSMKKRRHSGPNNRERSAVKSHPSNDNNDNKTATDRRIENDTESSRDRVIVANPTTNFKKSDKPTGLLPEELSVQCSSTVVETANNVQSSQDGSSEKSRSGTSDNASNEKQNNEDEEKVNSIPKKLSTSTDTQELMKYSTVEVQTIPYDMIESESEITDEPVENLSLLTKELLNRTEIHERIAENINKAILPTDGFSLKDLSFSECIAASECNTSIMTELNNAIKSIVTATQSDPVFEKFFDEIFQPEIEGEQSPDEDARRNNSHECLSDESPRTMDECPEKLENDGGNMGSELSPDEKNSQSTDRSEAAQVNTELMNVDASTTASTSITTATTTTTTSSTTENQALEDFNAAAVQSIINANNKMSENLTMDVGNSNERQLNSEQFNFPTVILNTAPLPLVATDKSMQNQQQISTEHNLEITSDKNPLPIQEISVSRSKISGHKLNAKARRTHLPIPIETTVATVTVPTLIVCNKSDINVAAPVLPVRSFNNVEPTNSICTGQKSQYIPIAPKEPGCVVPSTIYLRTVNVAKRVTNVNSSASKLSSKIKSEQKEKNTVTSNDKSKEPKPTNEAITLYGTNENNSGEVVESPSLPTINVEESITFSGSGLSPFLKFNKKSSQSTIADDLVAENSSVNNNTAAVRTRDCDITKRTPKSLLKSRSMNHRLSLSTPRRRSGHIRALDFNTPPKGMNTSRRLSEADACPYSTKSAENSKSICRTSLFKSPPFENSSIERLKNPRIVHSIKALSADSSPVPKLYGGWDKVSGVGTILGNVSPNVSITRTILSGKNDSSDRNVQLNRSPSQSIKSWDADLRQSLDVSDSEPKPREKLRKRSAKSNANDIKVVTNSEEKSKKKSEPSLQSEMNKNKLTPISESENSICNIKVLKTNLTETVTVDKQGVTKKYAKLKTLATNIKRIDNNDRNNLLNVNISREACEKSVESTKHLPQNSSNVEMELETPRKNETTLGIPPTPRVLSPSHSTPFVQVTEDSGKVRCFITTPEFPATPCINLTPRQASENTADTTHGEFSAPYFHPSTELKEILTASSKNQHDKMKTNKPEITQFEVIKENLPKDEACKELNISINSKDAEALQSTKKTIEDTKEIIGDSKTNKSTENSGTMLSDSSDSESDTTSSSCSSSSSCSCNDNTTNNSSRMSLSRRSKDTSNKNEINTSMTNSIPKIIDKTGDERLANLCERAERQIARVVPLDSTPCDQQENNPDQNVMWKKNESSPEKVFPIVKTQQALDDADTETPAKDETLLCEAEISETPRGSNSGIESLTNLTSKISAFIVEKEPTARKYHGSLRKVDAKLSVDSVKTNIFGSLSNPGGINRQGKESLANGEVIAVEKSNQIAREQKNGTLDERNGRTKSLGLSVSECPLKLRIKLTGQTTERTDHPDGQQKLKREIKSTAKNNSSCKKNGPEEKATRRENEVLKKDVANDMKNIVKPVATSAVNKSSINGISTQSCTREQSELLSINSSNPQTSPNSDENIEINSTASKAELSVLESLKLVPASKLDVVEIPDANSSKSSQHCHREFSFIHDDAVNTKKRNVKKFTPSDLEFAIQLRNDEFATMTASRFEILFTLPSKGVRARQTRKPKFDIKAEPKLSKPTVRSIKILKGTAVAKPNRLPPNSAMVSQPLATSSPVQTQTTPKVTGKVKSVSENIDESTTKPKIIKHDVGRQTMTTRKRKERSESKDDEPTEKKAAMTNPKLLLSRVNIDEFLTTVHGPITES